MFTPEAVDTEETHNGKGRCVVYFATLKIEEVHL